MATIFNVHGYTTMRNCLDQIRKNVEVCAYRALCAALSPTHDNKDDSWYTTFLEEDRLIAHTPPDSDTKHPTRPIAKIETNNKSQNKKSHLTDDEGFILDCSNLDMQAFSKILFYREAYRNKVADYFQIKKPGTFQLTCSKLIGYRNKEFAHLPVSASEKELFNLTPELEQQIITDCNNSIALFFEFLRHFPNLGNDGNSDPNTSYYNRSYNIWCETKKQLMVEEVDMESIIQREGLQVNAETLVSICHKCGINVIILDGKASLITANYKSTMKPILAMVQMIEQNSKNLQSMAAIEKELEQTRSDAQATQSEMENQLEQTRNAAKLSRKQLGMVIALCSAFIGILVILLGILLSRDSGNIPTKTDSKLHSQPAISATTPSKESNPGSTTPGSTTPAATADTTPAATQGAYTGPAFISGSGSYAGLTFQVNQVKSSGILITYTNTDASGYTLGWVGGAQVDVKTSVGTFTLSTGSGNQTIDGNSSGSFSINLGQELQGVVESITITDIRPLSTSGLPQGNSCTIVIPIQEGAPGATESAPTIRIRGEGSYEGLKLTVDQAPSSGIRVSYENDEGNAFSLGWVKNAQVLIKTSDGSLEAHVAQTSLKIEKETVGSFVIEVAGTISGTVEKIVIHDVYILSDNGLPKGNSTQSITIPITQSES